MAGYATACELLTMECEDDVDINRLASTLCTKIIMKSNWLYDALVELDNNMGENLIIHTSSQKSTFLLRCVGALSTTEIEYPNEKSVLESFETDSENTYSYRFSLIRHALKALQVGSKVNLRIDENGTLSIQIMLVGQEGLCTFVDFCIVPLDLVSEDEEEDEEEEPAEFNQSDNNVLRNDPNYRGDAETEDEDS